MQFWNDFVAWVTSDAGWRIVSTAILPFVAILVAALIGALLGRGSVRRVVAFQNRQLQAAAVATIIEAAGPATVWSGLSAEARNHAESQASASDIRLRLLPVTGASAAADWAAHELKAMRRDSAGFSFQAEQTYVQFRDRLLEWQAHPGRARKLFALDLERFRYEDAQVDAEVVEQQQRWAADEVAAASTGLTASELAAAEGGVEDVHETPIATTPNVTPATFPATTPISAQLADLPGPSVLDRPASGLAGPPPVLDAAPEQGGSAALIPPLVEPGAPARPPLVGPSAPGTAPAGAGTPAPAPAPAGELTAPPTPAEPPVEESSAASTIGSVGGPAPIGGWPAPRSFAPYTATDHTATDQTEPEHAEPEHAEPEHVDTEHVEPEHTEPEHTEPEHVEATETAAPAPTVHPPHLQPEHTQANAEHDGDAHRADNAQPAEESAPAADATPIEEQPTAAYDPFWTRPTDAMPASAPAAETPAPPAENDDLAPTHDEDHTPSDDVRDV
ncbi:hypothetical protein QT381_15235 [Galbitalea sp. SE-J8]|uniref:hypothetical protein n=1 Tax=Galbitalea sp. SE-J8 TaxID=3054952 RepID=UPI00259D1BF6|nr:hypothetical protein [Galbitalea sp. SE-J8]MDM4764355.1 hypothetical protein [Galbitalea sp. SE-J8]